MASPQSDRQVESETVRTLKAELGAVKDQLLEARRESGSTNQEGSSQSAQSLSNINHYELLVENAKEYAIFTMDVNGKITTWNPGAKQVLLWTEEEAIGQTGNIIFTENDQANGRFQTELSLAAKNDQANDQRWHVRKNGEKFWANGMMFPLRDDADELKGFTKLLRDDTERKKVEEKIKNLNDELEEEVEERTAKIRDLTFKLTIAEQQERQRISRLLHDDLQQQLYGVQIKLNLLQADIRDKKLENLQPELVEAEEWILQSIRLTRQLSVDLSPPILEQKELTDIFLWLASQMEQNHSLKVSVISDGTFPVEDKNICLLLFQCVRELLFNIVKHSGVAEAQIILEEVLDANAKKRLAIRIVDQGQGFDIEILDLNPTGNSGMGAVSVRERLSLFGSRLELESTIGTGTQATIYVPIRYVG